MNIAYFGYFRSDAVNGVPVVGYAQARALVQAGHRVFFYFPDEAHSLEVDEIGITRRGFKRRRFYQLPAGFAEFIRENPDRIDVFHLHGGFYPINALVARLLVKVKLKYAFTPHGTYNRHIFRRGRLKKSIYYLLFEKRLLHQASAVFCVAAQEQEDLKRLRYTGIMGVAHNPIDNFPDPGEPAGPSEKVLIYLGRYDAYGKGLDLLLHLFKYIADADPAVTLKLFGQGADKAFLERLAAKLGLGQVQINDPIYGTEKIAALRQAALYVQTSRWEAGGTAIVEAALSGTPVAVSAACYLAPFLTEKGIAITLSEDPKVAADQILALLSDEEKRRRMGQLARQVVLAEFNGGKYAEAATKLYRQVIGAG
ncbi:MAG: glycosyltransferase family 4 protein [Adhaeribacter sp.]